MHACMLYYYLGIDMQHSFLVAISSDRKRKARLFKEKKKKTKTKRVLLQDEGCLKALAGVRSITT